MAVSLLFGIAPFPVDITLYCNPLSKVTTPSLLLFGTDCANWNSREILNGRRNARFAFTEIRPLYGMASSF